MGLTRTRFSQANTAIAKIQDPITVLNSDSSVANVDVGFLINRNQGTKSNVALYWSETGSEFVTAVTANTGVIDANIAIDSYANLRVGTVFANIGSSNNTANIYITGSVLPSANISYDLGSTDHRFKTLWLSGNTIVMGSENLSVNESGEWIFTSAGNTVTVGSLTNFQGNGAIVGNLTVTNTLTLLGNTYTITSEDLAVVDSVIDLHTQSNLAPLTSNDGRDIGLKFHYYDYQDEHAFLGRANDTGYLEWYDSGREGVGNVFTGNTYGTFKAGAARFVNTTPSISTTTGALRVVGGVGIGGNLYIANTGDVSANIGTIFLTTNALDANVGAYQIWSNANAAGQQTTIDSLSSNSASQQTAIDTLDANVGSYQLFANANISTLSTDIENIITGANANVSAYLLTATGNIAASNFITAGNLYGSIVPGAIYKDVYIGTTAVSLARSSDTLTVDNFNTTGYAATANSAALAANATKTTVTSNISAGTAYVTFVPATSGNVEQNINTALTYDPNNGNLSAYGLVTTSGVFWANGTAWSSAGGGGGGTFTASNTAPVSPNPSDFWYYVAGDILFQYMDDGDSEQWVDIGSPYNTQTTTLTDITLANVTVSSWSNVNTIRTSLGITPTTIGIAPPVSPQLGDTWYNTNEDVMYQYINDGVGDWWVDISSDTLSTVGATNLLDTRVQGNIIPTANLTYSLGNVDYQWKDLYVSSNTIYIGGVPVGISNGNLLVNNAPIIPAATYSNVEVAAYMAQSSGFATQTTAMVLPSGTTAQRPATAANGAMRYNTTLGRLEAYMPTAGWLSVIGDSYTIDYLVVAGGGAGGGRHSGGGGGGGLVYAQSVGPITPGANYTATIGGGASAATGGAAGGTGTNTTLVGTGINVTAYGGGGGGAYPSPTSGGSGGSGGGAGSNTGTTTGGSASPAGQGYAGGNSVYQSTGDIRPGGGGGGAAAAGTTGTDSQPGHGGAGYQWVDGYYYSGGGGGGVWNGSVSAGNGGIGGGGGGALANGSGSAGTGGGSARNTGSSGTKAGGSGDNTGGSGGANTGGGGGGNGQSQYSSWTGNGGAGGSGIVIIRYAGSQRGTGGTISSAGGYTYHVFTALGTYTS